MELLSEDDILDLADASKAKLVDVQLTNAAVGYLEVIAAGTSAAPASMTPISTSSSAADWLNHDRVWDGENVRPSHFFVCPSSHLPHVGDSRVRSYPSYTVHKAVDEGLERVLQAQVQTLHRRQTIHGQGYKRTWPRAPLSLISLSKFPTTSRMASILSVSYTISAL